VTSSSLRWLEERAGEAVDAVRFRSTFVIDGAEDGRIEDSWVGRELQVGEARLEVVSRIPRCAVIDLDPETGQRDRSLLKALDGPELAFGVDAVVVTPGLVRVGDELTL
jgi:uncharacterized protein YcbX